MEVQETVIRLMTRLAVQHGAMNLSQGFTDAPPLYDLVWGGVAAALTGADESSERLENLTLRELIELRGGDPEELMALPLKELFETLRSPLDQLNHYSFPFGLPELRQSIADYTEQLYGFRPDPETQVTVMLGATEAMSSTLRAVCQPGDGVLITEPFHEMYPTQSQILGFEPLYATMYENADAEEWELDREQFAEQAKKARVAIINSPHNPTGKVFNREELEFIAQTCRENDLLAITDEIYEHILYGGSRHMTLATFEGMAERTIVINSISKTGSATGWRVGWVLSPADLTQPIRGIHDSLVMQAPTPLQKGAARLLRNDPAFFTQIRVGFHEKRSILIEGLRKAGFRISSPEGSYYLFADYREVPQLRDLSPAQAAMYLIEEAGVASVPGDNFYASSEEGNRYLRFAFCRGRQTLREAVRRLGGACGC